jgi:predicted MPP superfamily phosphohydrolase
LTRYDESFKTPHVKWRKPSATGKIKALILVPASGAREIAEFAERFDIDYKTIFINQSAPWTNGDFFYIDLDCKIRKGIQKLLSENTFDVIILGGVFWKRYFQGGNEKLLLDQVRKGAGLVYVAPNRLTEAALNALPVVPDGNPQYRTKFGKVEITEPHPAIDALDFSLTGKMNAMFFKAKPEAKVLLRVSDRPWLTVGSYGDGRVAALTYRVTGNGHGEEVGGKLTPRIWSYNFGGMGKASEWNYDYWEYSFALLGKVVAWAARRHPANALKKVSAKFADDKLSATLRFKAPLLEKSGLTAEMELFDHLSTSLGRVSAKLAPGGRKFTVKFPENVKPREGRNAVHVFVKNSRGETVDYGTVSFRHAAEAAIAKISLSKRIISKNTPLRGVVSLKRRSKIKTSVTVRLFDAYDRVVDERALNSGGNTSVSFVLNPADAMEVQGYVEAELRAAGKTLDIRRVPLKYRLTKAEREWSEFKIKSYSGMWSLGMPAYLYRYYYGKLAEIGFHELEVRPNNPQEMELTSQQGFRVLASGIAGMKEPNSVKKKKLYLETKEKKHLVRERDLCDPAYLKKAREFLRKMVKPGLTYSSDYMMYDEDSYSFYGLDLNFSEPSLKAFRKWLKTRYANLADLNRQWATDFKKWSDVMPMTLEEIRARQRKIPYNVAPWAEHRKFNEVTVIKTWNLYKKWIHQMDPLARMGQSGTSPTGTYGGNDWSKLAKIMDFIELYSNYGHQGSYVHCFTKSYITPWSAGYAYTDQAMMWNNAIREGRGGICAYRAISMIRPDMSGTYSTGGALAEFAKTVRAGTGKLMLGDKVNYIGDVAIHFSPECMRGAWALGVDQDKIRDSYCDLLENLGYRYFYLAKSGIENGSLTPKRFKLLILPYATALSDKEKTAIIKYVHSGGVVFADLHPGVFNDHCSPVENNSLDAIFALRLNDPRRSEEKKAVSWGGMKLKPNLAGTLGLLKPKIVKNGKGYAVYADSVLITVYDALRKKSDASADCAAKADAIEKGFAAIMRLAKACPAATVEGMRTHPKVGISEFSDGANHYLVVVDGRGNRKKPLSLHWTSLKPEERVYETVTGRFLGKGKKAKLQTSGIGNVFVALPYEIAKLAVDAPETALAGQKWRGIATVSSLGSGKTGRHVVRMVVRTPNGRVRGEYTRNLDAPRGVAEFAVPFAFNDQRGIWSVEFTELFSGKKVTLKPLLTGRLAFKESPRPRQTSGNGNLVGEWRFDDPKNLEKATIGAPLEFHGSGIVPVSGPKKGDGAIRFPRSAYCSVAPLFPPSPALKLKDYSFSVDFKIPNAGQSVSFLQLDPENLGGAWFLVNEQGGIGAPFLDYTIPLVEPRKWHRLVFTVKNEFCRAFLDGKLVLATPPCQTPRFAMDPSKVLFFADGKDRDGTVDVANLRLFKRAMTDKEAAALGGFAALSSKPERIVPYLQSPTPKSMVVSWYQTFESKEKIVEYGKTAKLGKKIKATTPIPGAFPEFASAKLAGLLPETTYFYRIASGDAKTAVFSFKTPPRDGEDSSDGHVRFVIYGDSRSYSDRHAAIVEKIAEHLKKTRGSAVNGASLVFNVGDIVGDGRKYQQYFKYYFDCLPSLSKSVPFMIVVGNHEKEANYYYPHVAYEDFAGPEGEKYYSFPIGKILFVVMNTEVLGDKQLKWVRETLDKAQKSPKVDWIVMLSHYPVYSESWHHKYSYRAWLTEKVVPMAEKRSKVAMFAYGHTHAYERGALENAPIYLLMSGGGGAPLENWRRSTKHGKTLDMPMITKSICQYTFSTVDIDVANKKMTVKSYGMGSGRDVGDVKLIDEFSLDRSDRAKPAKPKVESTTRRGDGSLLVVATPYAGGKPAEYAETRIIAPSGEPLFSILKSAVDLYDVDATGKPLDHADKKSFNKFLIPAAKIPKSSFAVQVRYRDSNLNWSDWSSPAKLDLVASSSKGSGKKSELLIRRK